MVLLRGVSEGRALAVQGRECGVVLGQYLGRAAGVLSGIEVLRNLRPRRKPPKGHPASLWRRYRQQIDKPLGQEEAQHKVARYDHPHGFPGVLRTTSSAMPS